MTSFADILAPYPDEVAMSAATLREMGGGAQYVVLDDDPTGTQSVHGLPVLARWQTSDLAWALGTEAPAVYVETNSRSLPAHEAATMYREIVRNALAAGHGRQVEFVTRSDSTLRGHFPLEPQTIADVLADAGQPVNSILVIPAFPDAGRITVGGIHYAGSGGAYLPVGETEFARDATFGYESSRLADWVQEKSDRQIAPADVAELTLATIRRGAHAVAEALSASPPYVVVDAATETDLRVVAAGIHTARLAGRRFVYRVGPTFVRPLIGQEAHAPLTAHEVAGLRPADAAAGGLIVVGSHTQMTSQQLADLASNHRLNAVEIDVAHVVANDGLPAADVRRLGDAVCAFLAERSVILQTTRDLVTGSDKGDSLRIARLVSAAVTDIVRYVVERITPRFVVAKGGITSSDTATKGLGMTRATVVGSLLPGLVSLWQPTEGLAQGIPYVVFPGNVGSVTALREVVEKFG